MVVERALADIALAALLAAPAAVAAAAAAAPFGIVMSGRDGALRVFVPAAAASAAGVSVQYPGATQQPLCCLHFSGDQLEPAAPEPAAIDAASGEPLLQLRSRRPVPEYGGRPFVGIATFGAAPAPRQTAATTLRLPARDSARSCFSAESFHVRAFRAGRQVADYYLGLGYSDERPTCRGAAVSNTPIEK